MDLWLESEIVEVEGKKYLNDVATERFLKFYPDYKLEGDDKLVLLTEAQKTMRKDKASKILPSYKADTEEDVYGVLIYDVSGMLALGGERISASELLDYGDILTEANFGHKMDREAFDAYFKRNRVVTLSHNIEDLISKADSLDTLFVYLTKHTRALTAKKYDKEKICDAVVDYIHGKGYDLASGDQAKELADFISKMVGAEDPLGIVASLTDGSELTPNEIFEGLNNGKSLLELIDPKAYEEYQAKEEAKKLAEELSGLSAAEITERIIKQDKDLIISNLDKFYDVLPEDKWNEVEEYLIDFVATVFKRVSLDPKNEADLNKIGTILATICKFQEDTKSQLFGKIAERLGISFDSLRDITSAYAFGIGYKGVLGNLQGYIAGNLLPKGDYKEIVNILNLYETSESALFNDDFYHQIDMSPAMFKVKLTIAKLNGELPMSEKELEDLLIALQHCNSKKDVENVTKNLELNDLLVLLQYLDQNAPYYKYYVQVLGTVKVKRDPEVEAILDEARGLDDTSTPERTEEPPKEEVAPVRPATEPVDIDELFDDDEEILGEEAEDVLDDTDTDEDTKADSHSAGELRVTRRRKPKTASDKKKVVYAVVAGVGIVSSLFMTTVLHQNPITIIKECASTFGRLLHSNATLGELAAKLGNLTVYFGSIVAGLVGANKLGNAYVKEESKSSSDAKKTERIVDDEGLFDLDDDEDEDIFDLDEEEEEETHEKHSSRGRR